MNDLQLSLLISSEILLEYLIEYKNNSGQRHSWGEVERDILNTGHRYAHLVDRKKLRHWEIGRTIPDERFISAVQCFVMSKKCIDKVPTILALSTKNMKVDCDGIIHSTVNEKERRIIANYISGYWCSLATTTPLIKPKKDIEFPVSHVLIKNIYQKRCCIFHMIITPMMAGNLSLFDKGEMYSGLLYFSESNKVYLDAFNRQTNEAYCARYLYIDNIPSAERSFFYKHALYDLEMDKNKYSEYGYKLVMEEKELMLFPLYRQIGFKKSDDNISCRLVELPDSMQKYSMEEQKLADEYFKQPVLSAQMQNVAALRIFDKIFWDVIRE